MKIRKTPIDMLDADPKQPRKVIEREPLGNLAGSISQCGLLQPIIVFESDGRFAIVDGHRRVEACRSLGIKAIDSIVLARRPSPAVLLQTQLAANCLREDLKPLEKAKAYHRLKRENGWSNTKLAEEMNVSKAMVTQTLAYLGLPAEAKELLDAGKLSGSTAYKIARTNDEETRAELLCSAKNSGLTRKEANRRVSKRNGRPFRRSVFQLGAGIVTVATAEPPQLLSVIDLSKSLIRECRRALKDGLDISTFERVLADRQRASSTKDMGGQK